MTGKYLHNIVGIVVQSTFHKGSPKGTQKIWLPRTDDSLMLVILHILLVQMSQKRWLRETDNSLNELSFKTGLTVHVYFGELKTVLTRMSPCFFGIFSKVKQLS